MIFYGFKCVFVESGFTYVRATVYERKKFMFFKYWKEVYSKVEGILRSDLRTIHPYEYEKKLHDTVQEYIDYKIQWEMYKPKYGTVE